MLTDIYTKLIQNGFNRKIALTKSPTMQIIEYFEDGQYSLEVAINSNL